MTAQVPPLFLCSVVMISKWWSHQEGCEFDSRPLIFYVEIACSHYVGFLQVLWLPPHSPKTDMSGELGSLHSFLFVCIYVAVRWTGDLYRASPCYCPMTAGRGSIRPLPPWPQEETVAVKEPPFPYRQSGFTQKLLLVLCTSVAVNPGVLAWHHTCTEAVILLETSQSSRLPTCFTSPLRAANYQSYSSRSTTATVM